MKTRGLLLGLLLALVSVAASATPATPVDGRPPDVVLAGDALLQAGLLRPAELFRFLPGWQPRSLNGFDRVASGPGSSPALAGGPEVWVDGEPFVLALPGQDALNRWPVSVAEIVRIEAWEGPVLVRGRLLDGLVNIVTREPERRLEAALRFWRGNEAGDPGPFRFVGSDAPNVDKLGGDLGGTLGARLGAVRARAVGVGRRHIPTDPAIRRRYLAITPAFPDVEGASGLLELDWSGPAGEHRLRLAHTAYQDYLDPVFTSEVPVETAVTGGSLGGTVRASGRLRFAYRAALAASDVREMATSQGVRIDETMRRLDLDAAVHYAAERRGASVGLRRLEVRLREAGGPGCLGAVTTAYLRGYHRWGSAWRGTAEVQRSVGDVWGVQTVLGWQGEHGHRAGLQLTAGRRGLLEAEPMWYWFEAAAGPLVALGVPVTTERRASTPLRLTGRVEGRAPLAFGAQIGGRLWIQQWRDLAVPRLAVRVDPEHATVSGPVTVLGNERGSTAGASVEVVREAARWGALVNVRYLHVLGGSSTFVDAYEAAPDLLAHARVDVRPAPSFAIGAALRGATRTTWRLLDDLGAASVGVYDPTIRPWIALDATAAKSFWHHRLRTGLVARNLLNRPLRSHPFGFEEDFNVSLSVALRW